MEAQAWAKDRLPKLDLGRKSGRAGSQTCICGEDVSSTKGAVWPDHLCTIVMRRVDVKITDPLKAVSTLRFGDFSSCFQQLGRYSATTKNGKQVGTGFQLRLPLFPLPLPFVEPFLFVTGAAASASAIIRSSASGSTSLLMTFSIDSQVMSSYP